MKKYFVLLMALMMLISTFMGSFAQANLFRSEPKKSDETLCAIIGAIGAGVVAHNVVGKDLVTIVAAFIGGAIGHDYCKNFVNNAEYQAVRELINLPVITEDGPSRIKVETSRLLALMSIYGFGSRNSRNDSSTFDQCVLFDFSVWRKVNSRRADDQFMGHTQKYWACHNGNGSYDIVRGDSGIYPNTTRTNSVSTGSVNGSGSVGGGGISASAVANWAKLDFKQIAVGYRVQDFVIDAGNQRREVKRAVLIRTRFNEGGVFAGTGTTPMGTLGVKMAIDTAELDSGRNSGRILDENDVAIECDVLPYCQSFPVQNFNWQGLVLNGRAMYVFKNGDMVVVDFNQGRFIIPRNLLVR